MIYGKEWIKKRMNGFKFLYLFKKQRRFDLIIKIPVPKNNKEKWGDYYFAFSMKKEFEKLNYKVCIQLLPEWYVQNVYSDIVIVLRGLSEYKPDPGQVNIMWNISHPDKVTIDEYNKYDYVFIASEKWAGEISQHVKVPVEYLLQCTDPSVFKEEFSDDVKTELLFVGNSRKVYRKIIKDLLPTRYELSVYGTLWDGIIDHKYVKREFIPNNELHKYYSSCDILLNDHWDDMRANGFLSNRLFDGFASGAFIISDDVEGANEVFGDALAVYKNKKELEVLIDKYINNPELRKKMANQGRNIVLKHHTFQERIKRILVVINEIKSQKGI